MKKLTSYITEKFRITNNFSQNLLIPMREISYNNYNNIINVCEEWFSKCEDVKHITNNDLILLAAIQINGKDIRDAVDTYYKKQNIEHAFLTLFMRIRNLVTDILDKIQNIICSYLNVELNDTDAFPIFLLTENKYKKIFSTIYNSKELSYVTKALKMSKEDFIKKYVTLNFGIAINDKDGFQNNTKIQGEINKQFNGGIFIPSLVGDYHAFCSDKSVNKLLKLIEEAYKK